VVDDSAQKPILRVQESFEKVIDFQLKRYGPHGKCRAATWAAPAQPLNAEVRRIVWKHERYSCQQASNRTKEDAETTMSHEITAYLVELSYRKTKRQRL
jgi:hypothetical protein